MTDEEPTGQAAVDAQVSAAVEEEVVENPAEVGDDEAQAEGLQRLRGQMTARFADEADHLDATNNRIDGVEERLDQVLRAIGRLERRLGTQETTRPEKEESEISFDGKSVNYSSKKDWVKFGLVYSGKTAEEDFDSFCLRFETCCNLNDVPKESYTMLLGVYVKDLAATYLREIIKKVGTVAPYSVVKARMKKRLTASHGAEQVALELSTIKQGANETVRKYYERFRKLVSQGEDSELSPFVLLHFRQGLRPKIKKSVMALAGKTLPELLQAATGVEAGLATTAEEPSSVAANYSSDRGHFPPQNTRFNRTRDTKQKRLCYRCGSDKHLSYHCDGSSTNSANNSRLSGHGRGDSSRGGYQQRTNNHTYNEAQGDTKQRNLNSTNGKIVQQNQQVHPMQSHPWMQPPPWMAWYGQRFPYPPQAPGASFASTGSQEKQLVITSEKPEPVDNCTIFASSAFEVIETVEEKVVVVEPEPIVDVVEPDLECSVAIFDDTDLQTYTNTASTFAENKLLDVSLGTAMIATSKEEMPQEDKKDRSMKETELEIPAPTQTITIPEGAPERAPHQSTIQTMPLDNRGGRPNEVLCDQRSMRKGESRKSCTRPPDRRQVNAGRISHLLLSVLCLFTVVTPCACQSPMICRTGHTIAKFKIPQLPPCILPDTKSSHEPYDLTFTLYKPNLVQYKSKAFHCRIVKTEIVTHSGFFANGQTRTDDYYDQQVSRDTCYSMFKWHTSPHGDLVQIGTLYQTDNIAEPAYHSGFYCCKDYEFTVYNAYLYETTVFKRHGEKEEVESPAGVTSHCTYLSGFCNLRDGSALLWEPDRKEQCQYLPHQQFHGKFQDRFWMADSGELALSFNKNRIVNQASECGGEVQLSDQGIACNRPLNSSRSKRQINKLDGAVTDSEVNSKLQALELRINENYNHLFRTSFLANCQSMQSLAQLVISALERNPTLATRHLLNHTYIHAKLTHDLLSVYPCERINEYSVLTTETCSSRIPLNANLAGNNQSIWLDTHTNIAYHTRELSDCSLDQEIPVSLEGQLYYYHHNTGDLTKITNLDSINLVFLNYSGFVIAPDKIVIHELLLYD